MSLRIEKINKKHFFILWKDQQNWQTFNIHRPIKKEKTQIINLGMREGTPLPRRNKKIVRDYYEQLDASKLDNQNATDKLLEIYY